MNELTKFEPQELAVTKPQPTALDLLAGAIGTGITAENVAVVEKLVQLRREEVAEQSKKAFAMAFFKLKRDIASLDLHADKIAKNDSGVQMFTYCSEKEISDKLEPLLMSHGFAMLTDQKQQDGVITVTLTIIHEAGHSEDRSYGVRAGGTNRVKDATAADTSAATSAWRHLMIKNFGLKSRISEDGDPRNLGTAITPELANELQRRVKETNSNEHAIMSMAGIKVPASEPVTIAHYKQVMTAKYEVIDQMLSMKERKGR